MKSQISSIGVKAVNSRTDVHALKGSHKPSCSTWSKIVVFGSAVLLADARIHHSFNSCESWRSSCGRNEPKSRRRQRRQNNPDILISSFSAETGSTRGKIRTGWWKKVPENWVSSPKPGPLTVPHRIGSNRMYSCGSIKLRTTSFWTRCRLTEWGHVSMRKVWGVF